MVTSVSGWRDRTQTTYVSQINIIILTLRVSVSRSLRPQLTGSQISSNSEWEHLSAPCGVQNVSTTCLASSLGVAVTPSGTNCGFYPPCWFSRHANGSFQLQHIQSHMTLAVSSAQTMNKWCPGISQRWTGVTWHPKPPLCLEKTWRGPH